MYIAFSLAECSFVYTCLICSGNCLMCFNSLYHSTAFPLPTVFPPPTGGSGDWRLIGSLDMLNYKNQRCPSTLTPYITQKACGRLSGPGCSSVILPTGSGAFRQICGRVRAFKWCTPDGFAAYHLNPKPVTIDGPYVRGRHQHYVL